MEIPFASLFEIAGKIIDRLIPDPVERDKAKQDFFRLQQEGKLEEIKVSMSAILAEAQSSDPWTSRARPSFLYVVYTLILFSLPMGLISAASPETATAIATGMREWLNAIPTSIVELFQWVMLGYIGGRSFEKVKGAAK